MRLLLLFFMYASSRNAEQESTLARSYFALKESISLLESYHRIGFMDSKDESTMKILEALEGIHEKFETVMIQTTT